MYRVEPRHKFSADISRTSYVQPLDYIRPAVGGFTVGLVYMTIVSLFCSMIDPSRAALMLTVGGTGAVVSAWIYSFSALIAAGTVHALWYYRLSKYGPGAFERNITMQIPAKQAFELCLAASAQMNGQRIVGFNDEKFELRVQLPASSCLYENTDLDIRLSETIEGVTHISVTAQKAVTRFRMCLLQAMWGTKWVPLILAVGNREQHEKAMDDFAERLRAVPDWNYAHSVCAAHDDVAMIDKAS